MILSTEIFANFVDNILAKAQVFQEIVIVVKMRRFKMTKEIDLDKAIKNTKRLVDDLTYASYAWNRRRSPMIAPERWVGVFPNWQEMEERFQKENA